jgi:hypothetical protein
MMSLETIRALSDEAAREARKAHKVPRMFTAEEIAAGTVRDIPNLGGYLPRGWCRVSLEQEHSENPRGIYMGDNGGRGAYFVDKGWSSGRNEPALAIDEFIERMQPGVGYGIVEEGQFQVKVGAFSKQRKEPKI